MAKDGNVIIAAGNNKLFWLLCELMGRPDLKDDPRFLTVEDRVNHHQTLKAVIEEWTVQYPVAEIVGMVNAGGVPASPVNTLDQVAADTHIAVFRNMFPEIEQTGIGRMKVTNCPQRFAQAKAGPQKAAPLLGEDNAAVYQGLLGLEPETLEKLKAERVI